MEVGFCAGDTSGVRVHISEGAGLIQHVTQGMGVDVGLPVVDTSGVWFSKQLQISVAILFAILMSVAL